MSAIAIGLEYGKTQKKHKIKFFDILKKVILEIESFTLGIVKTGKKQKIGLKPKSTEN